MILDLEKLEGVTPHSKGWEARCPACAVEGRDSQRNHLFIFRDGKFNCIKYGKDTDHNREILTLAGGGSDFVPSYYKPEEPKLSLPKEWSPSILSGLIKDYSYWIKRGINIETCEKFQIGVAQAGQMRGRSVIPIFNVDHSKIMGFTGRKLNDEAAGPKWKHLSDKKLWMFSGHSFLPPSMDRIILVESPVCVMRLSMEGIQNTLCLFGTRLQSKITSYLLQSNPKEILIATNNEVDNDSIGNLAAEDIQNTLLKFFSGETVKIALPIAKDFGDSNEEEMKEWRGKWEI